MVVTLTLRLLQVCSSSRPNPRSTDSRATFLQQLHSCRRSLDRRRTLGALPQLMKQRNAQGDYTGELPSMREVRGKTEREKIKLLVLADHRKIEVLNRNLKGTNARLHVMC